MKLATFALCVAATPLAAQNRIDEIRPDAPELAPHGSLPVGVQTMEFTDPGRIDVVNATEAEAPTYDRTLVAEVWYPAAEGTEAGGTYTALLRDGVTEVSLEGIAARDAAPAEGSYPLVLISHGYPGNRFLLSHLGENLASKGYVVASLDHPDSTYDDQTAFPSTLANRPVDQAFAVDALQALEGPVGAIIDDDRVGVVGYSMGGYGALIYAGGGLSQAAVDRREPAAFNAPGDLLARNLAGSESHAALADEAVRAVVAIGPWGRNRDFWDAEGLAGVSKPLMIVAGSVDDVSEYPAMRSIFEETTGTDRLLLTFENANHNAAAPMPAPAESYEVSEALGRKTFDHYGDAVWDTVRMNNVLAHFVTAFMDTHVKGEADKAAFLDVAVEEAAEGVVDRAEDGSENAGHTYWPGFPDRTAVGLRLERRAAGE
ncbi:alpha/beta fold hydrolase [Jannaschia sp. W003]|uniref:alpha/beta hydrolase family protein n=1 Tax=Jannaschia sp. W003 TaxID=2867012 RepID=UPI0021A8E654|nr:alpha/beta fold hydrolase [Jannaschia sp. W003]UWQ20336.1 alpha/beta fold hydrolase [Jannaschia sp. W003]